jgi:hypothetical protein
MLKISATINHLFIPIRLNQGVGEAVINNYE